MKKKSSFLLLMVGLIALCEVQILKAPGFFESLGFGGPKGEKPTDTNGGRRPEDDTSGPRRGRGPRMGGGVDGETGGTTTIVPVRVTPKGGAGTGAGRSSSGGSGGTTVADETGPGWLDVKEARAVEEVGNQRPSFSAAEIKSQTIAPDIEGRKADKIRLIEEVRTQLARSGLGFAELRECEGLPSYREIEEEINALYKEIINKPLEKKIGLPEMSKKIADAVKVIKEVESKLALEYYQREFEPLSKRVSGLNGQAVDSFEASSKAVEKAFKKGTLTLKQAQDKITALSKLIPPKDAFVRPSRSVDPKQEKANAALKKKLEEIVADGKALEAQRAQAKLKAQGQKAQDAADRTRKADALRDKYNLPKGGN